MRSVQINELRIGNWVDVDGVGTKVKKINEKGWINDPIPIEDISIVIGPGSIKPIPITKEIIIGLEFRKIRESLYELELYDGLPFCNRIVVRLGEGKFENWASVKPPVVDNDIGSATSFHELQNLYFMMTGEEILKSYLVPIKTDKGWTLRHQDLI